MTVVTLLLIAALILVFLHAIGVSTPRVSLGWLGLAFYMLAQIIGAGVFA